MDPSKFLLGLLFFLTTSLSYAQPPLTSYLQSHHFSFSLDSGFNNTTSNQLKLSLKDKKLVLQAEGGSHSLNFYTTLPFVWIRFLHENFGLTHAFFEMGRTTSLLINQYLQTGDTGSMPPAINKTLWRSLYAYNATLPPAQRITTLGPDFESRASYLKAMKLLLPATDSPSDIKQAIDLIKNTSDTLKVCDSIIRINDALKESLTRHKASFQQWLGPNYPIFEGIVLNHRNCNDRYNNRNPNMASNFLGFDAELKDPIYYGELGEAHTLLNNHNTVGAILNRSGPFGGKVAVCNLYCYNCTATEEVSNWPLKKIEPDIIKYFLPLCKPGFTLFDLSGDDPSIKKYREYGQFLIIARDQQ